MPRNHGRLSIGVSLFRWNTDPPPRQRISLGVTSGVPRYEGRAFAGYIGTGVDITEQKLARKRCPH
jgi:hypothetical protein